MFCPGGSLARLVHSHWHDEARTWCVLDFSRKHLTTRGYRGRGMSRCCARMAATVTFENESDQARDPLAGDCRGDDHRAGGHPPYFRHESPLLNSAPLNLSSSIGASDSWRCCLLQNAEFLPRKDNHRRPQSRGPNHVARSPSLGDSRCVFSSSLHRPFLATADQPPGDRVRVRPVQKGACATDSSKDDGQDFPITCLG